MTQCPVCREPLPQEHWRVFADHYRLSEASTASTATRGVSDHERD